MMLQKQMRNNQIETVIKWQIKCKQSGQFLQTKKRKGVKEFLGDNWQNTQKYKYFNIVIEKGNIGRFNKLINGVRLSPRKLKYKI